MANAQINFFNEQYFKDDLRKLIDYVYHEEKKHYIGCPSRHHIYVVIRRLAKYIQYM